MPYLFSPPVVYDRSPIYIGGNDRYRPVPRLGQRLMSHYGGQPRGRTLLKIGGTYTLYDTPSQEIVDTATEVYIGGHVYEVSDAVADALIAAGYGITQSVLLAESGLGLLTEDGRVLLTEGVSV